jgi:hypothetical protein
MTAKLHTVDHSTNILQILKENCDALNSEVSTLRTKKSIVGLRSVLVNG